MLLIAREVLQYEKNYINYYINIPKIYYEEKQDYNFIKNEMIDKINQLIFEDIIIFMDVVEENYNLDNKENIIINSLTEFQASYISENILSLAIEFSQISGLVDISYIKGYNYDFHLNKKINLEDLFKTNINYLEVLKKYVLIQFKKFLSEMSDEYNLENINRDNIYLDKENTFYFTNEYLVLPFSSCELDEEILNLMEFKIPFNKIYSYLSDYAKKNIVKK